MRPDALRKRVVAIARQPKEDIMRRGARALTQHEATRRRDAMQEAARALAIELVCVRTGIRTHVNPLHVRKTSIRVPAKYVHSARSVVLRFL
eukprot:4348429-Prymnesium_polylepis.1